MFLVTVGGWYPLTAVPWLAAAVSLLGAVGFGLAIIRHRRFRDQRDAAERLLKVNDESLQRCGGAVVLIRSCERPHDVPSGIEPLPVCLESGPTWQLSGQSPTTKRLPWTSLRRRAIVYWARLVS